MLIGSNFKLNKVVKNFISLTCANIIGQLMMFVATVYIARYFGPNNFGIINFSNIIVSYFITLASFGLQTFGTIEIAKSNDNNNLKINTILSLRIILASISYSLIIILVIFIHKNMIYKLNILFYGLTVFPTAICVDWIFNANEEMQYNSRSIIIKNLIYSLLVIVSIIVLKISNIYYVALYMFIATLLSSIYLINIMKKHFNLKIKFIFDIKSYKYLIKSAWPFFFSGVFAAINSNIATLMLGFMRSDYEIGLYNSVYKIVNAFIMIVGILFTPIYPLFIKYYNDKKYDLLSKLFNSIRKYIYIMIIPLIAISLMLNKEIIITLYGNKYLSAHKIFAVLMIYIAALYIREIYGYGLSAWNLQKKYMNVVFISSIYNIISNLIFIRKWGIEGASINLLISEFINLILMYKASRTKIKFKYENQFILKTIFSSIIMCICIYYFKQLTSNAIILSSIGAIIYILIIFISKTITINELKSNLLAKEE